MSECLGHSGAWVSPAVPLGLQHNSGIVPYFGKVAQPNSLALAVIPLAHTEQRPVVLPKKNDALIFP